MEAQTLPTLQAGEYAGVSGITSRTSICRTAMCRSSRGVRPLVCGSPGGAARSIACAVRASRFRAAARKKMAGSSCPSRHALSAAVFSMPWLAQAPVAGAALLVLTTYISCLL